jgi:hypothetical protein
MKKRADQMAKRRQKSDDDMREEYDFSRIKGRRNPYAASARRRTTAHAVLLDADVAAVFKTSASVNKALRAIMAAFSSIKPDKRKKAAAGNMVTANDPARSSQ